MNTQRLLLLVAFAGLTCVGLVGAGQPPAVPLPLGVELPPGAKIDEKGIFIPIPKSDSRIEREWLVYELQGQKKMRDKKYWVTNGVEMDVTVQTLHRKEKATEIEFTWTLTYTGPRPPLIILEPSLTQPSAVQTYVRFFAIPKGAKQGRAAAHGSPSWLDLKKPGEAPKLEDLNRQLRFVTVEKEKSAKDTTSFPVEKLKKRLLDDFPNEFDADTPPELWVKFVHNPRDRGDIGRSLDAWTGELKSRILAVPELKGW
jgi:hypothetical protein